MGFAQGGKTTPLTDDQLKEVLAANEKYSTQAEAAEAIGLAFDTFRKRLRKARARFDEPALSEAATETGFPVDDVSHYWIKTKGVSAFIKGNIILDKPK